MGDVLAPHRYASQLGEYQPAQRLDILIGACGGEVDTGSLLEALEIDARIGDESAVAAVEDLRLLVDVMLVVDVADDLLDEILDGNESVGTAIFVDDECEMNMCRLHLQEEIEGGHGARDVEHFPLQLGDRRIAPAQGAVLGLFDQRDDILDVDHAERIVEGLAIDRQTRMLRLAED